MSDHPGERLSSISTSWSVVCRAHQAAGEEATGAREELLRRYGGAVRRYLCAAARDADAADELYQEFVLRFLQGRLRGADPQCGRFRDFLRGVLSHLVADHHKAQRKRRQQAAHAGAEAAVEGPPPGLAGEDELLASWRAELLARAWAALAALEGRTGQPFYTALHLRANQPKLPSAALAEQVAARAGRPCTAVGVRQVLHRARERFADFLIEEVAHSLQAPTLEGVEQELIDLGLLEYCKPRLRLPRRKG
jgi:DNA-directed RNA polymerase specialized sigma24 family protein